MADDIDLANDMMANEVSRALKQFRQNAPTGEGTKECIECGDDMPAGRRKMGFKVCVPCAEQAERKRSLFID